MNEKGDGKGGGERVRRGTKETSLICSTSCAQEAGRVYRSYAVLTYY